MNINSSSLRDFICERFKEEDFKLLCDDFSEHCSLDFSYEKEIRQDVAFPSKIAETIYWLKRRKSLERFIQYMAFYKSREDLRSDLESMFPDLFSSPQPTEKEQTPYYENTPPPEITNSEWIDPSSEFNESELTSESEEITPQTSIYEASKETIDSIAYSIPLLIMLCMLGVIMFDTLPEYRPLLTATPYQTIIAINYPLQTPITPTYTLHPTNQTTITSLLNFSLPTGHQIAMAHIPAGVFTIGSNAINVANTEKPAYELNIPAFWVDVNEVTNEQFNLFVSDTSYLTTAEKEGTGGAFGTAQETIAGASWKYPFGPESSIAGQEQDAVVQVSWNDAMAYCEWRGATLPTEEQWEKAARGTEGFVYPWGNEWVCNQSNSGGCNDGFQYISPVGSFSPEGDSSYGVSDMIGNVWEWTNSNLTSSHEPDATEYQNQKVIRGGSWGLTGENLRSTLRVGFAPTYRNNAIGFRCVVNEP